MIIPNVPEEKLAALQAEPIFQRFPIHGGGCRGGFWVVGLCVRCWPAVQAARVWQVDGAAVPTRPHLPAPRPAPAGPLLRGLVSCTGAQFCSLALIETKNRALEVVRQLEAELDIPSTVRIHWTGCPNSCGQVSCCASRCAATVLRPRVLGPQACLPSARASDPVGAPRLAPRLPSAGALHARRAAGQPCWARASPPTHPCRSRVPTPPAAHGRAGASGRHWADGRPRQAGRQGGGGGEDLPGGEDWRESRREAQRGGRGAGLGCMGCPPGKGRPAGTGPQGHSRRACPSFRSAPAVPPPAPSGAFNDHLVGPTPCPTHAGAPTHPHTHNHTHARARAHQLTHTHAPPAPRSWPRSLRRACLPTPPSWCPACGTCLSPSLGPPPRQLPPPRPPSPPARRCEPPLAAASPARVVKLF